MFVLQSDVAWGSVVAHLTDGSSSEITNATRVCKYQKGSSGRFTTQVTAQMACHWVGPDDIVARRRSPRVLGKFLRTPCSGLHTAARSTLEMVSGLAPKIGCAELTTSSRQAMASPTGGPSTSACRR